MGGEPVQRGYAGQMIHVLGEKSEKAQDFIAPPRMVCKLKLINCLILEFLFNILDHSWLWATETEESKTTDKGGLLYFISHNIYHYIKFFWLSPLLLQGNGSY